jgi:hypothetical protein
MNKKVACQLQNGAALQEHPQRSTGGLLFLSPEAHATHSSNFHRRIRHPCWSAPA